jgi:hypothetical protein
MHKWPLATWCLLGGIALSLVAQVLPAAWTAESEGPGSLGPEIGGLVFTSFGGVLAFFAGGAAAIGGSPLAGVAVIILGFVGWMANLWVVIALYQRLLGGHRSSAPRFAILGMASAVAGVSALLVAVTFGAIESIGIGTFAWLGGCLIIGIVTVRWRARPLFDETDWVPPDDDAPAVPSWLSWR